MNTGLAMQLSLDALFLAMRLNHEAYTLRGTARFYIVRKQAGIAWDHYWRRAELYNSLVPDDEPKLWIRSTAT